MLKFLTSIKTLSILIDISYIIVFIIIAFTGDTLLMIIIFCLYTICSVLVIGIIKVISITNSNKQITKKYIPKPRKNR